MFNYSSKKSITFSDAKKKVIRSRKLRAIAMLSFVMLLIGLVGHMDYEDEKVQSILIKQYKMMGGHYDN